MERFFRFREFGTTYRRETLAGLTTFLTLAYIIIVNPAILSVGGIPREASTTATILAAAFGTIVMALVANRPFAIAPYMCENAFVAFTVVGVMGLSWQTALAAIFYAGIIFIILTVTKLRRQFAEAIPLTLKHSFAVGMRIFLAFIPVGDIFHEQQNQHIIFILGSIHAATQFIATFPQGRIEFTFFNCHR